MEVGRDDLANSPRPREPSRSKHGSRCHKSVCGCELVHQCVSTRPGTRLAFVRADGYLDSTTGSPQRRRRWQQRTASTCCTTRWPDVLHEALAAPPQPIAALAGRFVLPIREDHRLPREETTMHRNLGSNRAPAWARGLGGALTLALVLIGSGQARAQEPAPTPTPPAAPPPGGGAVHGIAEDGHVDLQPRHRLRRIRLRRLAVQGCQARSSGDLSDNWAESFAKPAVSASFGTGRSELYGKLSAVGERTFAATPPLIGDAGARRDVGVTSAEPVRP